MSNKRYFRILFVFFITWLSLAGYSQKKHPLEKVKELKLNQIQKSIPAYFSTGYSSRAQKLSNLLKTADDFYYKTFGIRAKIQLAVLNKTDWEKVSKYFPYGALFVTSKPYLVVLPATTDVPVTKDFVGLKHNDPPWLQKINLTYEQAANKMIDIIGFHELGHIYTDKLGIHPPTKWFGEFMASYFAFSYFKKCEPEFSVIWNEICRLKANGLRLKHTTLEDFEKLYFGVGLSNYIWYQGVFQGRVEEIYKKYGVGFLYKVKEIFPADKKKKFSNKDLLLELEKIEPGFLKWAEIFNKK